MMVQSVMPDTSELSLPVIRPAPQPNVSEQVFNILQQRILSLELPPQTKISEADVSKKMGVSRQPVREAFKRLAKLGFLNIRPQSGTLVSLISERDVLRAKFIRIALEVHTCRTACEVITPKGLESLNALIAQQRAAVAANDKRRFHALDDAFHREICVQSGVDFVWELILESKAHMDRIRMLSLDATSQRLALNEHIVILDAITARKPDDAAAAFTQHLSRIDGLIALIKAENHSWFTDDAE
ncbi:GntR family transcriptional regulator [Thalassobacter stenotrophicus]|uniref:GntR family transcriptional regulator n=1 Tax=Thalassobacter stenotrophicus TaxID=266809 RepID=UPI0022A9CD61|nr:GntR family transcriptional regulator [Thalassobacter stenotrophicus]UYP67568.1 GntR family transcriptional regulator [Thalassobacter stenotrophicus]